jgi:Esterase-like activity of phytase/LVIVD repeat
MLMIRKSFVLAAAAAMLATVPLASIGPGGDQRSGPIGSFRQIATLSVPGATSAEIISVSRDGRRLVYSDAIGQRFGLVDISDPRHPQQLALLPAGGDPTSVAVLPVGNLAAACVQPGRLILIDLTTFTTIGERAIGAGPDSVAITTIGGDLVAVIAIENEGALGKGFVEVVRLNLADFASSTSAIVTFNDEAALTAAGLLAVADPQPEYVSIRGTKAAVTLQENNGIAIIDISNPAAPALEALFSAGIVDNRLADLTDDSRISFTDTYPADKLATVPSAGARLPDAIAWTGDGSTLFTADEGEANFTGGRGWSAHAASGAVLFDDGGALEAMAVRLGHYPDGRSDAKGIEAESLVIDEFTGNEFMFVGSERGAFVAVYRLEGSTEQPRFVQFLPTGQAPEGILTIPSRNLLVTANEGDDADGTISIFEGVPGPWNPFPDRPVVFSGSEREPWGALSGLAASPENSHVLFAVPDNALPTAIYAIHVGDSFARLREQSLVTRGGAPVLFDLEGIAIDTSIVKPQHRAGFWLASEGNASSTRNALIQVDRDGEILREIHLPPDVDAPGGRITSNGFEGVAVSGDGRFLVVAIQRPYAGETIANTGLPTLHTRIARYDLALGRWEAFFYPLESSTFTIGLSEIIVVGATPTGADVFAVIERDNQLAANGLIKRIYTFTLEGLTPEDIATPVTTASVVGSTVTKSLLRNVQPQFTPYEKVEGLARTRDGDLWVALDNDGGEFESRLVRYRGLF